MDLRFSDPDLNVCHVHPFISRVRRPLLHSHTGSGQSQHPTIFAPKPGGDHTACAYVHEHLIERYTSQHAVKQARTTTRCDAHSTVSVWRLFARVTQLYTQRARSSLKPVRFQIESHDHHPSHHYPLSQARRTTKRPPPLATHCPYCHWRRSNSRRYTFRFCQAVDGHTVNHVFWKQF